MLDWFEIIAAGDIVPKKKPAADIYDYVLEQMKLPAADCLAFEDSENGLISAMDAGIVTIVTINDYTQNHNFDRAKLVLSDLGEPDRPCQILRGDTQGATYVDLALLSRLVEYPQFLAKTPMTIVKDAIEGMLRSRIVDTGRVSGLSRQIIAQMNNLQTGILLNFESLPGIVSSREPHLNLFLQSGPKESLRAALREGTAKQPNLKMTINSAYRTVVQQYVLFQLYRRDRKLVPLAAIPAIAIMKMGWRSMSIIIRSGNHTY